MRLVDAEPLEKRLSWRVSQESNKEFELSWAVANEQFLEDVKNCRTVDAVPVVRCRECKYCSPGLTREERSIPDADLVCAYWDSDGLDANDFCSHGERKGGDE